jgi:hypothetical protein
MVDGRLFVVTHVIVDNTEVDMSEELSSHISDLLVLHVIRNGVVHEDWVDLSQLHEVYTDAVVSKGLSMYITDCSTDLKELLVLLDGFLVLSEVVIKNACAVVGSALISGLSCSLASESQDVIVLQSLLSGNTVVRVGIAHGQTTVVVHDLLLQTLVLLDQTLLANDVFLPFGCVEIDWQFDALSLVYSQRKITFLL